MNRATPTNNHFQNWESNHQSRGNPVGRGTPSNRGSYSTQLPNPPNQQPKNPTQNELQQKINHLNLNNNNNNNNPPQHNRIGNATFISSEQIEEDFEMQVKDFEMQVKEINSLIQQKKYDEAMSIAKNLLKGGTKYEYVYFIKELEIKAKIHLLKEGSEKARDLLKQHSRLLLKEHMVLNERPNEELSHIQRLKMHANIETGFKNLKKIKNKPENIVKLNSFLVYDLSKEKVNDFFLSKNNDLEKIFENYKTVIENKKRVEKNYEGYKKFLNDYEPNPQAQESDEDFILDKKERGEIQKPT